MKKLCYLVGICLTCCLCSCGENNKMNNGIDETVEKEKNLIESEFVTELRDTLEDNENVRDESITEGFEVITQLKNREIDPIEQDSLELIKNMYTSSGKYEDFVGVWNRTECESSMEGQIIFSECTENGVSIKGDFASFANTGELSVEGYYISEQDVFAYEEEGAAYLFSLEEDSLLVYQFGDGEFMGLGVFSDGTYTKGEPEYINENVLESLFSQQELDSIHQLFIAIGEDEELYFIAPFTDGVYEVISGTAKYEASQEEMEGRWLRAYIPHLGEGYTDIFVGNDGEIFIWFKEQTMSTQDQMIVHDEDVFS